MIPCDTSCNLQGYIVISLSFIRTCGLTKNHKQQQSCPRTFINNSSGYNKPQASINTLPKRTKDGNKYDEQVRTCTVLSDLFCNAKPADIKAIAGKQKTHPSAQTT